MVSLVDDVGGNPPLGLGDDLRASLAAVRCGPGGSRCKGRAFSGRPQPPRLVSGATPAQGAGAVWPPKAQRRFSEERAGDQSAGCGPVLSPSSPGVTSPLAGGLRRTTPERTAPVSRRGRPRSRRGPSCSERSGEQVRGSRPAPAGERRDPAPTRLRRRLSACPSFTTV